MRSVIPRSSYLVVFLAFLSQSLLSGNLNAAEGKVKKKKKKIASAESSPSEEANGQPSEQSPATTDQSSEEMEMTPEPALRFGLLGALSLDMVKIKDSESSLAGLTLDLMGRMNYRLSPTFIMPIGLGMGFTSWAGEAKLGGATITYTVSATTLAFDIAGLYGVTPKAYIGLFVDNRFGLSGEVKVETEFGDEKAENKYKLDKFSHLLYGPTFFYFMDTNRIFQFDLGIGSGSYEIKDDLIKTEYTDTRLRFAFNYML